MAIEEKIITCEIQSQIPTSRIIESIPRGIELKVVFGDKILPQRDEVVRQWKKDHPDFQIGAHSFEPVVSLLRLIAYTEIDDNQDFFERCAKDYRDLSTELINEFARFFDVEINSEYPLMTLNSSGKHRYKQSGRFKTWNYFFHGIHCAFTNISTGQYIEVPLTYGLEFGVLDPYFFTRYIKSTQAYIPLPVEIFSDYHDGLRILERMIDLGKFEYINSNWPASEGVFVSDRDKISVKVFQRIIPNESKKGMNIPFKIRIEPDSLIDRIKKGFKKTLD